MKARAEALQPFSDESPAAYADRVGRWYASSVAEQKKKGLGQYLTPIAVAAFMARQCTPTSQRTLRALDPGAGTGILSCALLEAIVSWPVHPERIDLEAYEVDPTLAPCLTASLSYARLWLQPYGIDLCFAIRDDDFVMTHADVLDTRRRLFPMAPSQASSFDIVISNPPYFKLPKTDPRARAAVAIVHGQPNIYAFFMAISAMALREGGQLVFITPRSYTAGPYFRLFRERFFSIMRPEVIHLFGSRRDAFSRDEVLQENVILVARRVANWAEHANQGSVRVSSSGGVQDLGTPAVRDVPLVEVLDWADKEHILRIPVADEDAAATKLVHSWTGSLRSYGLEISTGPVVPFRATSFISQRGDGGTPCAPLLWMQNVGPMRVEWPKDVRGKEQYIVTCPASMRLLVPDRNYVLLRRFSAKEQRRRLTAAPLLAGSLGSPWIGLENHLNYIHRPGGSLTPEEAYGLSILLNSRLLDTYFRTGNGHTQVNATELRAMPLPAHDKIIAIGRRAMEMVHPEEMVDALVSKVLAPSIGI